MIPAPVQQILGQLADAIAEPVLAVGRSDERVFWLFLLAALPMATLVWCFTLRGRVSLWGFLFPQKLWLHPSSLFDLRFLVARSVLSAFFFSHFALSSLVVFRAVRGVLSEHLGPSPLAPFLSESPPLLGATVVTLFAFVGEDLFRFLAHRASHRVPFLWELHQVHHSARVLTPLSVYRTHPVEGLLMSTASALGLGGFAGVAAWSVGSRLLVWEISGVLGLSYLWNLLGSNLRHSHVWLTYPRWLAAVLISPADHQIHHSRAPEHHDKNFGAVFSIWDRLAGSHFPARERRPLVFGVPSRELNHRQEIASALLAPLARSGARLLAPLARSGARLLARARRHQVGLPQPQAEPRSLPLGERRVAR